MKDKHNRYQDKVVGFLVKGTNIDYKRKEIIYPYIPHLPHSPVIPILDLPLSPPYSFSEYVRYMYGLTEEELDYIWNEYKKVIKNKIENGR